VTRSVQHVPEEETTRPVVQPLARTRSPLRQPGLLVMFLLCGMSLVLFTSLAFGTYEGWIGAMEAKPLPAGVTPTPTPVTGGPLTFPLASTATDRQLVLPDNHMLLFEQLNTIYLVPIVNQPVVGAGTPAPTPNPADKPRALNLPGYHFNSSAPPILTPSGQLLYSGDGIWETNPLNNHPVQIAKFATGQIITSMALSQDGKMLAWSTAPANGSGQSGLYIERLGSSAQQIYQQQAGQCPCFRIFSFESGAGKQADATLLLTDDRGDQNPAQFGLWSLNLAQSQPRPVQLLPAAPAQGPLLFDAQRDALLYSDNKMLAPLPSDKSLPLNLASMAYANSLYMASINGASSALANQQLILPDQKEQSNIGNYRWITTPTFAPDGTTLVYIVFSVDSQGPYLRYSSLYTVQINGAGAQMRVGQPQLLATANTRVIELGPWLNDHIVTFYADGWIYALDMQSDTIARITNTQAYAHIVGII
jgi:hypothetical protein